MKIKNLDIRASIVGYSNASSKDLEIPFTTIYKIRKNMSKLEAASKPIDLTLKDIINKYTETDNQGNTVYKDKTKLEEEIRKVEDIETEVEIDMIPISEFGDIKVSPAFMNAIYFMLKD